MERFTKREKLHPIEHFFFEISKASLEREEREDTFVSEKCSFNFVTYGTVPGVFEVSELVTFLII